MATSHHSTKGLSVTRQPHPPSALDPASRSRGEFPPTEHSLEKTNGTSTGVSVKASQSSDLRKISNPISSAAEEHLPQPRSLRRHLNLCNTILGITGLVSALCFGVITIVQSNTANKEAKRSNDIALQSLMLSGFATCAQFASTPVMQSLTWCTPSGVLNLTSLWNLTQQILKTFSDPLLDNQGVEVLIRSPNCGFWTAVFTDTESDNAAMTTLNNQSWEAVSYVDSCYNSDAPSTLCDKFLPQRRLPTFEWSGTPSPFDVDVCLHTNDVPAFKMQTEMLDSHRDFGINAPHSDRIQIQRTTICSPLNVTRFTNITEGIVTGEEITGVYFGPVTGQNYTFAVSNLEKLATSGYHLNAVSNYVANGTTYSSTFTPIKELTCTNADVSVIAMEIKTSIKCN